MWFMKANRECLESLAKGFALMVAQTWPELLNDIRENREVDLVWFEETTIWDAVWASLPEMQQYQLHQMIHVELRAMVMRERAMDGRNPLMTFRPALEPIDDDAFGHDGYMRDDPRLDEHDSNGQA